MRTTTLRASAITVHRPHEAPALSCRFIGRAAAFFLCHTGNTMIYRLFLCLQLTPRSLSACQSSLGGGSW